MDLAGGLMSAVVRCVSTLAAGLVGLRVVAAAGQAVVAGLPADLVAADPAAAEVGLPVDPVVADPVVADLAAVDPAAAVV